MMRRLQALVTGALDLALPPLCPGCRAPTGAAHALCIDCWSGLSFISGASCVRCGVPFEVPVDGPLSCEACLRHPPVFDRARAPLVYDEASRGLILRFKHGDALPLARLSAPWLTQAGGPLLARADAVLPVPLARSRLWKRRYNQAALLAQAVAKVSGKTYLPHTLRRVRRTASQGGRTRAERVRNVKGAFAVRDAAAVRGKIIVLVDDVLTSGATADECARVLLSAGAVRVDVLTIARVKLSG